jgi:glutamyl-tRNA synthetase
MIRTRFAPSPTGYLHIGGARTALFSWLFARHHVGKCILRIEDTDQARSTPEAIQAILEGLNWLGLNYDEGPYFQSKRTTAYQTVLTQLLNTGHAYYCNCTPERLDLLRKTQLAHQQKPRYDGHCRDKSLTFNADQPSVVRFKNPLAGSVIVQDKILGDVEFSNQELDDFILMRSDGTPTYNFTVVVDDYEMKISHIIRGNDHLNNTPRQINVLRALNAPIPVYMHLPMLHSEEGKKLSKREGASSVLEYRKDGILPEALLNYLVRLGWSHGDQEIFSQKELIQYFDGNHLSKSPALLNQNKLLWLNQQYLKQKENQEIAQLLVPFTVDWEKEGGPELVDVVAIQKERVKTLKEMAEKSRFFYETPKVTLEPLSAEWLAILSLVYTKFEQMVHWEKQSIYHVLRRIVDLYQLKPKQLFQRIRLILTGSEVSPPIDETIFLLGKAKVLERLKETLESQNPSS